MSFLSGIFKKNDANSTSDIDPFWLLSISQALFCELQLRAIYTRILTDVIARSETIPTVYRSLLRDSMEGFGQRGLVEHIVHAMANQSDLVLKYEAGILYVPNYGEKQQIVDGWKNGIKPANTLLLSFRNYYKTTIMRQYLHHKYLLLGTQHRALNLSSALIMKIDNMRATVSLKDSPVAIEQAREIAIALVNGSPAILDSKDIIELPKVDIGPIKEVANDLQSEISLILGLPLSWVAGKQKVGLGDSGDADARAIDRGLEPYFWESIYPAFELLFGVKLKFRSENFEMLAQGLEALRTFELIGDDLISLENKRRIISSLLNIENDLEGNERIPAIDVPADPV